MGHELEALVHQALDGNAEALETLCEALREPVFCLSMRMLGRRSLAEECTQDVLLKVVTRLGSFQGRAKLTTWVHIITVRHVRDLLAKRPPLAVDESGFAQLLEAGLAYGAQAPAPTPEDRTLISEVRLSCTQGMLLMLSVDQRLALVLVDLLGRDAVEAAAIVEVSPAALRKRLSRARERLSAFLVARCGVVSPDAACSCLGQVPAKRSLGMSKDRQPISELVLGDLDVSQAQQELAAARTLSVAFGPQGKWKTPMALRQRLKSLLPTILTPRS